jgi:hypothetical protein
MVFALDGDSTITNLVGKDFPLSKLVQVYQGFNGLQAQDIVSLAAASTR